MRKPRVPKKSAVELRLEAGASVMKTISQDAPTGAFWTFADNGRAARADVCQRLIEAGKLHPMGDGLFGDAQTYALAAVAAA